MNNLKPSKHTVQDHLDNAPEFIVDLFDRLTNNMSDWGNVAEVPRGNYIGYWFAPPEKKRRLFVEVHVQRTKIKLHIGRCDYKNLCGVEIIEKPDTHKWTLTKIVDLYPESNVDCIIDLMRQSYHYTILFFNV